MAFMLQTIALTAQNMVAEKHLTIALTGDIMTMPGLPKNPAAYGIDVDDNGVITGLF